MANDDEFPANRWDDLKAAMEAGGAPAVIALLEAEDDLLDRRKLTYLAASRLAWQDWEGKTLDAYVAVADWAIDEMLRHAELEQDPEAAARRTDVANIISYNLSARLADCWEDDTLPRERRHFERGLRAADECLRWREELDKPAFPFSIAWWAKGMHELSLGDAGAARHSFAQSVDFAARAVREKDGSEPSATEHFGIALGEGYLGIAEHVAGDAGGRPRWEAAITAFGTMAEDESKAGDAEMGLAQIRTVWERYAA